MSGQIQIPLSVLNDVFGAETVRRGRAYADAGRVLSWTSENLAGGTQLIGRVEGSRRTAYVAELFVEAGDYGVDLNANCSCPVGMDCKHSVALLFVACQGPVDQGPVEAVPAPWASQLGAALGELEKLNRPNNGYVPLALQIEHRLSNVAWQAPAIRTLQLRPLQRGKQGGWVKAGVSWYDVAYSVRYGNQHDPAQRQVLTEMASAFSRGYSNANPNLMELSPLMWPLLRRAQETGIILVPGNGLTAIEVSDQPLAIEADLREAAGEISVQLGVRSEDTWWPGGAADRYVEFLGAPHHGVAMLTEVPPPGKRKSEHFELTLAPLQQSVPQGLQRLVQGGGSLVVPQADRASFVAEFLPRLRRQLPTGSSDASVELPEEVPPRLVMSLTWRASHEIETSWWWRYRQGQTEQRFELASTLDSPLDGASEVAGVRNLSAERTVMAEVALPGRAGELVNGPDGHPGPRQLWRGRELLVFVNQALPLIRDCATIDVEETGEEPDYRAADGDPEIHFDVIDASSGSDPDSEATTDWLDLSIRISVDGEDVPLATVLACLTMGSELVFTPSGQHVPADHPAFAQLAELVAAAGQLVEQPAEGMRVGKRDLGVWAELAELGVVDAQAAQWVEAAQALRDLDTLPEVFPSGLKSELRPYQESGLRWLAFLWQAQLGGILADDMGLGKTLQALALITHARERGAGPFLVVAPTSVVGAWAHEVATHAPGLVVRTITASTGRRGETIAELYAGADLVVTSYALFRLEAEEYAAEQWRGLILDEAQNIKNHQGKTYQAVRLMDVPFRLALTGTPFENRLMELWSLLSVAAPGLYPSPTKFNELVARPIERGDQLALDRFRRRIRPFLLRRTKELVAADLPPKQEQILEVRLNSRHRKVYDVHLQRERQTVLGLVDDFGRNRIAIFSALTRLRQLSLDAALIDAKHDKVGSAKLDALVEHLHELISEGHRALVFSQFTSYLDRVRTRLGKEGIAFDYLDGKTRNRPKVIDGFKNGDAPVFLISLKAGGVGLTLTEADYVFVLDPWWNPAVEAQAVDRTHRIGQERTVMVYRLVAVDTIEEKVMELKDRKAALFAQVIDGDGVMAAEITADDVRGIFED